MVNTKQKTASCTFYLETKVEFFDAEKKHMFTSFAHLEMQSKPTQERQIKDLGSLHDASLCLKLVCYEFDSIDQVQWMRCVKSDGSMNKNWQRVSAIESYSKENIYLREITFKSDSLIEETLQKATDEDRAQ